jgi:hypothetical protein
MSLPGGEFWPEGTCRIVQKPEVGQTALQSDSDGLGAVSHIQAHQYYADVRLNSGLGVCPVSSWIHDNSP